MRFADASFVFTILLLESMVVFNSPFEFDMYIFDEANKEQHMSFSVTSVKTFFIIATMCFLKVYSIAMPYGAKHLVSVLILVGICSPFWYEFV